MDRKRDMEIDVVAVAEDASRTSVHRWEIARYSGSPVVLTLTAAFDLPTEGRGDIMLTVVARYSASRSGLARPLISCAVKIVFKVADAPHCVMVTPDAVYLPPDLLGSMMGIGIGALRGMLALKSAGTFLSSHPLPVMSMGELISNMRGSGDGAGRFPMMEFRLSS